MLKELEAPQMKKKSLFLVWKGPFLCEISHTFEKKKLNKIVQQAVVSVAQRSYIFDVMEIIASEKAK